MAERESIPLEPLPGSQEGQHEGTVSHVEPLEHAAHSLALPADASVVRLRLEVPEDACLTLEVEARTQSGRLLTRQSLVIGGDAAALPPHTNRSARPIGDLGAFLRQIPRVLPRSLFTAWPAALVWLSFGLYLLVRLVDLPAFPIYFFTDEAVQTVQAQDLLRNHFASPEGELLPTFFQNGGQHNLGTSVYLQVLPYMYFGKSIWVTRGTSALMTLIAAASVWLILKRIFKISNPWLGVLILSATPAWFLHSRTAFETVLASSFYAAFLYCYLMYRHENPRYLYSAVGLGALTFYSYAPMRMVMAVTAVLLFLSDLKYHLQNRKQVLLGLGLAVLLALPYARFMINHPTATEYQMRLLNSYWLTDAPLIEKLDNFAGEYLHGLNPFYWYLDGTWDLPRHMMLGYGHLLRQMLPLGLLGVFLAARYARQSSYRTLLIAVLAVPSGTALVRLGLTRVLVMVIPMAILTALAAQTCMDWLARRIKVWPRLARPLLTLLVFAVLAATNLYMLNDALVNGPTWYKEYGLSGMQYGARQLFPEIDQTLREHPGTKLILSPSWSNGTDVVARFFFPDPLPFSLGSPEGYFNQALPLDENTLFVMLPEEYARIPQNRFSEIKVEKTLPYPDGRAGFYFVRLKYVENIATIVAAETEEHLRPRVDKFLLDGQEVTITSPRMDINSVAQIVDHDPDTMARTWAINPMELTFEYAQPKQVSSLDLRVGGPATTINVRLWPAGQSEPLELFETLPQAVELRNVTFDLEQPLQIERMWVSVRNTHDTADGYVHLWEITIK